LDKNIFDLPQIQTHAAINEFKKETHYQLLLFFLKDKHY